MNTSPLSLRTLLAALVTCSAYGYRHEPTLDNLDLRSPLKVKLALCKTLLLPVLFHYGFPLDTPPEALLGLTHAKLSSHNFHVAFVRQMDHAYQLLDKVPATGKALLCTLFCVGPHEERTSSDHSLTLDHLLDLIYHHTLKTTNFDNEAGAVMLILYYTGFLYNQWLYRDISEEQVLALFERHAKILTTLRPHICQAVQQLAPLLPALQIALQQPLQQALLDITPLLLNSTPEDTYYTDEYEDDTEGATYDDIVVLDDATVSV